MAQPYLGEIRIFAGSFAPAGWAFCDGRLLPISGNETLFQLIGVVYGGDGQSTFALPDLRGRLPMHQGGGVAMGQKDGVESVTLTVQQLPAHTHPMLGSSANGAQASPQNAVLASSTVVTLYAPETPTVSMAPTAVNPVGGSQPHSNMQPFLCVSFIISLFAVFPSQT